MLKVFECQKLFPGWEWDFVSYSWHLSIKLIIVQLWQLHVATEDNVTANEVRNFKSKKTFNSKLCCWPPHSQRSSMILLLPNQHTFVFLILPLCNIWYSFWKTFSHVSIHNPVLIPHLPLWLLLIHFVLKAVNILQECLWPFTLFFLCT